MPDVSSQSPGIEPRPRDLVILGLASLIFLGVALGVRDLWNPNEPTYGQVVMEMFESGDWLAPRVNGRSFAEKPLLFFWLATATAKALGGVSEVSLRLPVLLCGVLSTVLVFFLIHSYDGRRRAWLGAACFVTIYSIWFNARNAQMDSFVLLATLGVLVPLSRRLDGDWSGRKAWLWAGCAAGFGFAGKGPVTIVVPGLILVTYLLFERRRWKRLLPGMWLGILMFLLLASPGYVLLFATGRGDALHEMLFRQNFSRFVAAWDHAQPWWYYLKYFWLTFLPWSWFVPVAAVDAWQRRREGGIPAGERLAWIWLIAPLVFFSLSDSKREPYMLPAAPAIAWLAASVADRFARGRLRRGAARGVMATVGILGLVLGLSAVALQQVAARGELPEGLSLTLTSATLALCAAIILVPLTTAVTRRLAPLTVLAAFGLLYLMIAIHLHAAVNEQKSARGVASRIATVIPADGAIYSYLPRRGHIRGGYAFYLRRTIPNLLDEGALRAQWADESRPCVLYERPKDDDLIASLPGGELRIEDRVGSRRVRVFCKKAT